MLPPVDPAVTDPICMGRVNSARHDSTALSARRTSSADPGQTPNAPTIPSRIHQNLYQKVIPP